MTQSTCTIEECEKPTYARTWCSAHYKKWQRLGDPTAGRLPPAQRLWAKAVRNGDCLEYPFGRLDKGYRSIKIGTTSKRAHRYAYELTHGPIPDGMQVDHTCWNRACIRPEHLRLATNKQNAENRQGPQSNNKSSGVRGVQRNGSGWVAQVCHNGERFHLGTYRTIEEAEAVVIEARRRLFTHSQD